MKLPLFFLLFFLCISVIGAATIKGSYSKGVIINPFVESGTGTGTTNNYYTTSEGSPPYLYNDSSKLYFNETLLNKTIDDRDDVGGATGNPFDQSLNTTDDVYFNSVNVTGWFGGLFNFTVFDNWLKFTGSVLSFNESKLSTTYFNATQAINISGLVYGVLSDTQHQDGNYDEKTFNFTERASAPALDLRMNFTGITAFTRGIMRYKTSALSGAYPIIQVWSYDDNDWEDYPPVSETLNFATIEQGVFDDDSHIGDGVVQMRIYKASNGNVNNKYYVDWVAISKGFGTPSGEEVDPYSVHLDGSTPMTGNLTIGGGYISNGTNWFSFEDLNRTGATSTFNSTYHDYRFNVSRNWTLDTFNTWNTVWLTTYNATYEGYLSNVSRNWTMNTYDTWNTDWLKTFNSTYHDYRFNVSTNWTQVVFDAYNTTWDDTGMGNESWNETRATQLFNSTYNSTYESYRTNVSYNWTLRTYDTYDVRWTDTFNSTYHDYRTNVSLNYTKIVFDTYNSTWDDGGTGDTFNSTYHDYRFNVSRNWTLDTFNTWNTDWLKTYNVTYHDYRTNVSYNWTLRTYDTYDTRWIATFNSTYHDYRLNVSRNYTLDTYNTYNTGWVTTYNETYDGYKNCSLRGDCINVTYMNYENVNSFNISGNSTFKGHACMGIGCKLNSNNPTVLNMQETFTGSSAFHGIRMDPIYSPDIMTSSSGTGIGGYMQVGSTLFNATGSVMGLDFGPWWQGADKGNMNLSLIGVRTFGSGGSFTNGYAKDVYGLYVWGFFDGFSGGLRANNTYGIYIADSPTGIVTTNHTLLYIQKPTTGGERNQILLQGSGTGTGIRFENATGPRIHVHNGSNLLVLNASTVWAPTKISAVTIEDRSSEYDKLRYGEASSYLNDVASRTTSTDIKGNIVYNHTADPEFLKTSNTYDCNCVEKKVCKDVYKVFDDPVTGQHYEGIVNECRNEESCQKCTDTARDLGMTVSWLRQVNYEQKEEIELLKSELCKKDITYSFCK